MISKYIIGIIMIAIGILMIVKTESLVAMFGRIAWAEEKLGAEGGTRIFYKIIGMGIIVLAFMIMSGKIVGLLDTIFKH